MNSSRLVGIGIFVVVGLVLFGTALFMIGDRRMLFQKSFEVYTEFSKVSGLIDGAKVRVSGRDAGEVLEIQNPPRPSAKFRVKMRVSESLHQLVRTDSVVTLQTDGVVGNKFLQVNAGSDSAPMARPNTTLPSREPFDFTDLLEQASNTVAMLNKTVYGLQDDLELTLKVASETITHSRDLIDEVGDDIKGLTSSGNKVAKDLSTMIEKARAGEGTVGKLITDDQLYLNISAMTAEMKTTMSNVREATEKAKQAISDFQKEDDSGNNLTADLKVTLGKAREAMSDMAENMEALKRNFLFRGFFKKRGYYDLDEITPVEYRQGALNNEKRTSKRTWLHSNELFVQPEENGIPRLTELGKKKIDAAMADFLKIPGGNWLLIVEGYSGAATEDQQFRISRARAAVVKDYLEQSFYLDPDTVGAMPMGSVKAEESQQPWEGVALVLFSDKKEE
jgi:phospholipid/cholesterol/gamma-HCH transport system substrate-binding protein